MTEIVEADEVERGVRNYLTGQSNPPMTPPPRYALRSPDAYHRAKWGLRVV